jgi:hypothetical protein
MVPPDPGIARIRVEEEHAMKGYVRQRRGRYYAVIYEGLDPVTGKERRS